MKVNLVTVCVYVDMCDNIFQLHSFICFSMLNVEVALMPPKGITKNVLDISKQNEGWHVH